MTMEAKTDAKAAVEDPLTLLRWMREEERHEITWIGNRLSWMLLAQSFLITAAVVAQSNEYPWWWGPIATLILGCLGVWLAIRGGIAVRAAQNIIHLWLKREKEVCRENESLQMYRVSRELHDGKPWTADPMHAAAIQLHLAMDKTLIWAWVGMFLGSLGVTASQGIGVLPPYDYFAVLGTLAGLGVLVGLLFWRHAKQDYAAIRELRGRILKEWDKAGS